MSDDAPLVTLLGEVAVGLGGAASAAKAELLAYHLMPRFGRKPVTASAITPYHLQRGLAALKAWFDVEARRHLFTLEARRPGQPRDELDLVLGMAAGDAAIVRGSAYPEQSYQEIVEIQGRFEGRLARQVGIGPRRAADLVIALGRVMAGRYAALLDAASKPANDLARRWTEAARRRRRDRSEDDRQLRRLFTTAEDAFGFGVMEGLATLAPDRLPLAREDLAPEPAPTMAEWAALLGLIGCDQARRARMTASIEMRDRPLFVLTDGRVLLVDVSNALDQLWLANERAAQVADPAWFTGPYAKHKAAWLEGQVLSALRRVFPAEHVYQSLTYPDPDNPGGSPAELDAAIDWPPFLVLVEAKAKQFRLAGQLGDIGRLRSDLKANVADAFEQARRAERYVRAVAEARFVERGTGRALVVRRDAVRRTYLLTVSQHELADLATRLASVRALGLFGDEEYPWALSLADLDVVTRFCPGADVFLHYAERRLALQRGEVRVVGDELEQFGAYLDTRLQLERLEARRGDRVAGVMLSGYQQRFDEAMAHLRGELEDAPPIRLAIPAEIGAILDALRRRDEDRDGRWIAFSLLALPDRALEAIAQNLRNLRVQGMPPGSFRRATYGEGDWIVSIVATRDRSREELRQQTTVRAMLEKYRRRATRSVAFGIVVGAPEPFECLVWADQPWVRDDEIERLLRDEPPPLPVPSTTMPGRNALCYCGSGRKFKQCCLPRIESARRPPVMPDNPSSD